MSSEESLRRARVVLLVLSFMVASAGLASAQAEGEADSSTAAPRVVVQDTVEQVLAVLAAPGLDQSQRRARIETLAFSVFDFETVSRLVMARNWKKLDKAQRSAFVQEFKQYLSRNYGRRLERYEEAQVEVLGTRSEPRRDVTVLTRVVGGQYDGITMNYRLRERKSSWKVIDVVIEGVSMLANFRAQFAEVVSREGVDGLLEAIRTRNLVPDPAD